MNIDFRSVYFETDWRRLSGDSSYLNLIILDYCSISLRFDRNDLIFTRWNDNKVVDFLARNASTYANVILGGGVPT